MHNLLHLSTLCDDALHLGLVVGTGVDVFQLPHHQHAVPEHATKDHMLPVQPIGFSKRQEKLAAVAVWAAVCLRAR